MNKYYQMLEKVVKDGREQENKTVARSRVQWPNGFGHCRGKKTKDKIQGQNSIFDQ